MSKDNLLIEYNNLRTEINQKIELHNTLLTFTITTVVAILTFAFVQEDINPYLFLLPFCIIIPISMRIAYYRTTMVKISAYMIVFLEKELQDINWETRNAEFVKLSNSNVRKSSRKSYIFTKLTVLRYFECLLLSIVCYVIYLCTYLPNQSCSFELICHVIFPLFFVIFEALITKRINSTNQDRVKYRQYWGKIKENEN